MECPYCKGEVVAGEATCRRCCYPMQGDAEAQRRFLYGKLLVMQAEADDLLNWVSKSKYIMFFAAGITALRAVLVLLILLRTQGIGWWPGSGVLLYLVLLACGLAVLGAGIEKHPLRNVAIGFAGTLLTISGGFLGWSTLTVLGVCVYYAAVYERKQRALKVLRTKIEEPQ